MAVTATIATSTVTVRQLDRGLLPVGVYEYAALSKHIPPFNERCLEELRPGVGRNAIMKSCCHILPRSWNDCMP